VTPTSSTLSVPRVAETLDRLHLAARSDWKYRLPIAPRYALSRLTGYDFMPNNPAALSRLYSSVTRDEGLLLYLLVCIGKARRIVEFGCSFGISTLYLASAARDCGGSLVTTEIESHKVAQTKANLNAAGLNNVVTVLEGDALQTLRGIQGRIDLLFLDGMKHLYLPVLELLRDQLRAGSVIVADNVDVPAARAYAQYIRAPANGFTSSTLFKGRMEVSCLGGISEASTSS
jgi:predicted O-methyltransferase YrrM